MINAATGLTSRSARLGIRALGCRRYDQLLNFPLLDRSVMQPGVTHATLRNQHVFPQQTRGTALAKSLAHNHAEMCQNLHRPFCNLFAAPLACSRSHARMGRAGRWKCDRVHHLCRHRVAIVLTAGRRRPRDVYTMTGLSVGAAYCFAVRAYNATGALSAPSAEVSVTIAPSVPPVVTALALTANVPPPQVAGTSVSWLSTAREVGSCLINSSGRFMARANGRSTWTHFSTLTWRPSTPGTDYQVRGRRS